MKRPKKELLLPDEFVLEKDDILMIIKSITKHWRRDDFNSLENAAYIANMELIKTAVRLNNPKVLKELFYSIITAVHQVETLNGLKQNYDLGNKDADLLYNIQIEKIKNGSAFID